MFIAMPYRWWSFWEAPLVFKRWKGQMQTQELSGIRVRKEGREASLILSGSCKAEDLLDRLPVALKCLEGRARLQVDASQAKEWDSLALSALVVCLRNQANQLESVTLSGLPWWALGRLQFFGPGHMLGPGWTGSYEADRILLKRSAAGSPQ